MNPFHFLKNVFQGDVNVAKGVARQVNPFDHGATYSSPTQVSGHYVGTSHGDQQFVDPYHGHYIAPPSPVTTPRFQQTAPGPVAQFYKSPPNQVMGGGYIMPQGSFNGDLLDDSGTVSTNLPQNLQNVSPIGLQGVPNAGRFQFADPTPLDTKHLQAPVDQFATPVIRKLIHYYRNFI